MPVGDLRALVAETNRAVHGVAATVVRPAPNQDPVTTTIVWSGTVDDIGATADITRRERRKLGVLPRTMFNEIPRGTLITAPDEGDDTLYVWRVDSLDEVGADDWRVVVRKVGTPSV